MRYVFQRICTLMGVVFISMSAMASPRASISIDTAIARSFNFIQQTQFSEKSGFYSPGEWPVQMKSYNFPAIVGLGRYFAQPSQEATAFNTASVMNLLSEAYLIDRSQLEQVPSVLQKGLPSFDAYRDGDIFFYYPMTTFKGAPLHAPLDPDYVPRAMIGLALVPPDADTTSVSFTALAFADRILNQKDIAQFKLPDLTLQTLNQYRDVHRAPHLYNRLNGGTRDSGAYMTWLWDEKKGPTKGFFRTMNDSYRKGYRIVFGRNDVDCVVNANVMRMLTLTQNTKEEGYENSCEFLNDSILKTFNQAPMVKYCGLYYPNEYGAIYAISNAYKAGASCLSKSRDRALDILMEGWHDDGSWQNAEGIGRVDSVQSTASALGALLNYIEPTDRRFTEIVQKGVQFLLSQSHTKGTDQLYWDGEVFFSAGPAARSSILWRSDAYTTALCMLTIVKAQKYLNPEVTP